MRVSKHAAPVAILRDADLRDADLRSAPQDEDGASFGSIEQTLAAHAGGLVDDLAALVEGE